jgi:hypothetical protein
MLRKVLVLAVLVGMAGVSSAQKEKDKDTKKGDKPVKGKLVKVDVKGMTLTANVDGKDTEYKVTKETRFIGPRGGKTTIKDKRLQPGVELGLVAEGKTLKEVHIPTISKGKGKGKDKDKDKDKAKTKDKDKGKDKDK